MDLFTKIQLNELYMIVGMVIVTFGLRYIMFPISGRFEFPDFFIKALKYVPPAVLAAIIAPSVLMPTGESIDITINNPYLIGGIAALIVGLIFKNLLLTIVLSMCVFFGFQYFLI